MLRPRDASPARKTRHTRAFHRADGRRRWRALSLRQSLDFFMQTHGMLNSASDWQTDRAFRHGQQSVMVDPLAGLGVVNRRRRDS